MLLRAGGSCASQLTSKYCRSPPQLALQREQQVCFFACNLITSEIQMHRAVTFTEWQVPLSHCPPFTSATHRSTCTSTLTQKWHQTLDVSSVGLFVLSITSLVLLHP